MRHYDTTFFCEKGRAPRCKIEDAGEFFPWTIKLRSSNHNDGQVVFFIKDESDLIRFKNSVIEAHETMRRKK